jgi:16S rRNA (cytosine967-C5)-methyltransferase
MSDQSLKSARAIAAEVLQRFDPAHEYASAILDRLIDETRERQRATDLVYGTVRNLYAIDAVIGQFSGRAPARVAPALRSILRVGVYELVYSPATPVYSIVDEAVKNAGTAGGKKQTGFVNAVLRQVVRHITHRQARLSAANTRRALVQTPETECEFDVDFLPDPAVSLPAYLSMCFSLSEWLVTQWLAEFGPEQTRRICLGCNRRPSLYVRVNPLRTTAEVLLEEFRQAGIDAAPAPGEQVGSRAACAMLKVTGPQAVTQLPGFAEGLFTVQDLSASRAVQVLDPQPGWSILDLCAAPGTKTAQLAEATRDAANITATDIDAKRLERVRENIARLGLKSVTIIPYAEIERAPAASFDAILLDAPCSNTGVLARRVEARFRLRPQGIEELAAAQRDLLVKAARLVKPGGRICYSTCSIQRTENQAVVRDFLTRQEQFELAREELLLPAADSFDHDGAYVALLARK